MPLIKAEKNSTHFLLEWFPLIEVHLYTPSTMPVNYDAVAPFYDFLSRLVFGRAIVQAQQFLVAAVPAHSRVLIIGGGTGWIIEELSQLHGESLQITYVELSQKMMSLAHKRNPGNNEIIFVQQPIQTAALEPEYDVVITPFLLDNFTGAALQLVFKRLHTHIKKDGLWLFADFQVHNHSLWQKIVLKMMYLFFRLFCGIETTTLPSTDYYFNTYSYKAVATQTFFHRFIIAAIYQK